MRTKVIPLLIFAAFLVGGCGDSSDDQTKQQEEEAAPDEASDNGDELLIAELEKYCAGGKSLPPARLINTVRIGIEQAPDSETARAQAEQAAAILEAGDCDPEGAQELREALDAAG